MSDDKINEKNDSLSPEFDNNENFSIKEPELNEPEISSEPVKEQTIVLQKSSYRFLIAGLIVAIAVASFAGAYSLATFSLQDNFDPNDFVTKNELEQVLTRLTVQGSGNQNPNNPSPQPSAGNQQESIVTRLSFDDDPVLGDVDAPITIYEFSDFQCPFCAKWHRDTLSLIKENYISTGKVNLVYKDFPLDSIHPNAAAAHFAAECAQEQDSFWTYHDILFERQGEWARLDPVSLETKLVEYANSIGMDSNFQICLSSEIPRNEVYDDFKTGAQAGVSGTPGFFVGNDKLGYQKIIGAQPYSVFESVIEEQLSS